MSANHVVPLKIYFAVFGTLLVLTGVTTAVAYVDLGILNPVVALAIATFKAVLVILFFMHVKYSSKLTWLVVSAAFFWLGIMLSLTLADYLSRPWPMQ